MTNLPLFSRIVFSIALTLLPASCCFAQTTGNGVSAAKLTRTQGTSEFANIFCSLSDRNGNLWFGTHGEGLYRYDGKQFTQFTKKDGLNTNDVLSLLEDREGNIWIGTDSGVCIFDEKNAKHFRDVPLPPAVNYPTPDDGFTNEVWSLLQDRTGRIWIGARWGVYCYKDSVFSHFPEDVNVSNPQHLRLLMVDNMIEDRNGNIWLASGMLPGSEGLCRYDGHSLSCFKPDGDGWIRTVAEDKNGIIWFGTRHSGTWCYDGKTYSPYSAQQQLGTPALKDRNGNLWFKGEESDDGYSGAGGVWCYDGDAFRNIGPKEGLGNYGVWTIVEDRAGNIWIGTRNLGLYRYDGKTITAFSE